MGLCAIAFSVAKQLRFRDCHSSWNHCIKRMTRATITAVFERRTQHRDAGPLSLDP